MSNDVSMEQQVVDYLNEYCFQKIWTEPISELRGNIKPLKIFERSKTGSIQYTQIVIELPKPNKAYYVYAADLVAYRGAIDFPAYSWIPTNELCNIRNVLFHTYTESGLMLHKAFVYVYYFPPNNSIIIAVDKQMYDTISTDDIHRNIYTTFYFDSDFVNNIYIHSVHIPYNDKNFLVSMAIQEFLDLHYNPDIEQRLVFQQGQEIDINDAYVMYRDEYVDVIADKNIILSFDVDLTNSLYNLATYLSPIDETFKLIVHIPKELNPDNKLLTHNTCDFFIRKKDKDNDRNQHIGRFIHRCADISIGQITHNDFSIPTYILDAHRDHLQEENVTLHVVVRQHDKDNILIKEQGFLYLLYQHHTDEEIIKFLSGRGNDKLPFWKAVELEASDYRTLMFDTPTPIVPSNIETYINALGYYHTLALLCQRIMVSIVTDADQHLWKFRKAFVYRNLPIYANVYRNGYKLPTTHYDITNENEFFYVKLNDSIVLEIGDIIVAEMYVTGPTTVLYPITSLMNRTFEVPYKDVEIYIEHDDDPYLAKGIKYTSSKSYELITDPIGKYNVTPSTNPDNLSRYTVNVGLPLYNKRLLICNKLSSYTATYDLNPSLLDGNSLVISLFRISNDSSIQNVPILNFNNYDIFVNGRYLVRDIDYTLQPIYHPITNYISFYQIIIQNMSYLQTPEDHSNFVEIVLNCSDLEDISKGFVVEDTLVPDVNITLYFPEISSTLINGRFEHELIDYGKYYKIDNDKYDNHHVFEIKTCIPKFLKDFLLQYHPNTDRDRIVTLNEYFYQGYEDYPHIVLLQASHQLYSVYLNTIIRDIIYGQFELAFDPDLARLEQQLVNYLHIKNLDIVYTQKLDLTHIDVFPHYKQFLTDPKTRLLITNLINALMPEDLITAGELVHV